MPTPLMPKATAVWLVENSSLTFEQIADFCGLHILEVKGIADGDVAKGLVGINPIANGQLTQKELMRCQDNSEATLALSDSAVKLIQAQKQKKSAKYTPVASRQNKPDAVAWLIKNCPELTDSQIGKLIGSTKNTIQSIRNKLHWNIANIKPKDPVLLGICTQTELNLIYTHAKAKAEKK